MGKIDQVKSLLHSTEHKGGILGFLITISLSSFMNEPIPV